MRISLMPDESDVAYTAGLFDGEGSVSIQKNSQQGHPLYSLSASMKSTTLILLEYMQYLWGGGIYPGRNYNTEKHRQQWQWRLHGQAAADFLEVVRPRLLLKKEHASLGIEFQAHLHPGSTTRITDEEASTRRALYVAMGVLNKRGPKE
jgi:hypothetical protein